MGEIENRKKELIRLFLLEQLTAEQKAQFDQHMDDPAFQEELGFQKEILEVIEHQGDLELKSMLRAEEKTIKKRFPLRRLLAAAAVLLLLVFIGWQFLIPEPTDIFAEYFKPHPNSLHPIVKSESEVSELQRTFLFYEIGDFEKALVGFNKIKADQPNDDVYFYQANALLKLGRIEEAIQLLQEIIENDNTDYLAPAKWNLALAYLAKEDIESAKPLLAELANEPFHKVKVEKLLKESIFK